MPEKYIQTKGAGKGTTVVKVVDDDEHEKDPNTIVLETDNKFRYGVSKRDFDKHYMLLSEWEEKERKRREKEKKNTGVGDPSLIAPTSESPTSDACTRGEVPPEE